MKLIKVKCGDVYDNYKIAVRNFINEVNGIDPDYFKIKGDYIQYHFPDVVLYFEPVGGHSWKKVGLLKSKPSLESKIKEAARKTLPTAKTQIDQTGVIINFPKMEDI